jgi:hypothetical protein
MAKKTYEVVSPLDHNGKRYAVGKTVDLEDDEAAPLLVHTVKAPEKAEPKDRK